MAKNTTFSGLPINGDITYGSERAEQKSLEEFQAILQPVLDDPTIAWVAWRQYTPYFNDGDPCVFRAQSAQMALKEQPDPREEDDYDYYDEFPGYSDTTTKWFGMRERDAHYQRTGAYTGPDEARFDRCLALSHAIGSGSFDDVLLNAFGDHAIITITPKVGIDVETFDHD